MAGRLRKVELERLHTALQSVLREAIALGGSSVSDYVDADGVRGFFQLKHHVYMRTGQPCLVCGTPIRKIIVGGRSTHYCPVCQQYGPSFRVTEVILGNNIYDFTKDYGRAKLQNVKDFSR